MPKRQDQVDDFLSCHQIDLSQTDGGGWLAKVQVMTSRDEFMPYRLTAPSQSAMIELLRVVFAAHRRG